VAIEAEGDEIGFRIFAGVAAEFLVVDFQVCPGTAELTAPTVSPKHALSQVSVLQLSQPSRRLFWQSLVQ